MRRLNASFDRSRPRCLLVFEPPDGGVAENVMRLCLGLRAHGWEPFAAGPIDAITYPALRAKGIPVARLSLVRGYGDPVSDLRALRALVAIMRRHRFDLVHAHAAKAGVLGRLAAIATGTPAVYSPHCFPFVGPWGPPRFLFSLWTERLLGLRTAGLICVAEAERQLAERYGIASPGRRHVVLNGTPPCSSDTSDPALDRLAADGPLAACVAVLRPQKAVHVFVEAAPRILERAPEARLAVVGNGYQRDELKRRAHELGLDGRLHFHDYVGPAAMHLRSIDVFVLPSAWEGLPIAVLEAMACGVPQVATDVGGTSEAVIDGETGLLCPANDPESLADRVVSLLRDDELRRRMGAAARERHARLFGVERMVQGTARVYDAIRAGAEASSRRG